VQEPDHYLPGGDVAPEDVALSIAVEVALSDGQPPVRRRTRRTPADDAGAVHEPGHYFAADGAPPEDVALVVAVEVVAGGHRAAGPTERGDCNRDDCSQRDEPSPNSRSQVWSHCFSLAYRDCTDGPHAPRTTAPSSAVRWQRTCFAREHSPACQYVFWNAKRPTKRQSDYFSAAPADSILAARYRLNGKSALPSSGSF